MSNTAYEQLPGLGKQHPNKSARWYGVQLGIGDRSILKALSRLQDEGILVGTPVNARGELHWAPADDEEEAIPVRSIVYTWEPVTKAPGPRSIFELASCLGL